VIINLGTNDYSTAASPTDELFTSTYQRFLEHLRAKYPDAFILCTVGPMLTGSMLASARHNISAAVTARNDAGDSRVKAYEMTTQNTNPGCDSHPGLATHEAMAKELEAELKTELGW
jgi:lysophospholipase L1-like esterase